MICPSCHAPNRDDAKFCKSCRHPFRTGSAKVSLLSDQAEAPPQANEAQPEPTTVATADPAPASVDVRPAEEIANDPSLEPTLILTPEQMMAFHSRRWQREEELSSLQGATQDHQAATNSVDMSTPTPVSAPPVSAQAPTQSDQEEDIPTLVMSSNNEVSAIPPPPPSTPTEIDQATGASEQTEDAAAEEKKPMTSIDQSNQPADKMSPLAVGTTVAGRYEVTQVVSTGEQENIYQVTDHQGYQRCWNCGTEQNAQGDEFCTSCGAGLLDVSYTMHEYSATTTTAEDAHVLQGAIVNTFMEQGHTYMIEQPQAAQNAFPNGVHLLAASHSDAGDVRRSEPNEDSTLVLILQRIHESHAVPAGVFIVADGLGGHDNGQVASRMTISFIAERIVRELLAEPLLAEKGGEAPTPFDEERLVTLLRDGVEDANTALCQMNERDKTDMGSTITGFMVAGDYAYILNVGDSRTYMLRAGQLYKLTNDHSLVEQLVASGLIEPDDVYTHPQRSQIFRSLGDKLNVQIDIFKQQLLPGDILLSCSDGLWEMVRNPQLESILNATSDPQTACYQLVEAANANGGEDNVSAVIVFVH